MDSINIIFARYRLTLNEKSLLKLEIKRAEVRLEELRLESAGYKAGMDAALELYGNETKAHKLTAEAKDAEIEYYKSKKSPRIGSYLIGFLAGVAAASLAVAVF